MWKGRIKDLTKQKQNMFNVAVITNVFIDLIWKKCSLWLKEREENTVDENWMFQKKVGQNCTQTQRY